MSRQPSAVICQTLATSYKVQASSGLELAAWSLQLEAFAAPRAPRREGFTLIELLIVIAILAVAVGVVALSVPASDGRLVREEAARLGALFRIAQDEARVSGRTLVWEANLEGYRFRPLDAAAAKEWTDEILRPRAWPFTVLQIEGGRIVFGREPLLDPVMLRIVTAESEARLALDALGNLSLVQ